MSQQEPFLDAPGDVAPDAPVVHQPYIPASSDIRELTFAAVGIGALLGVVFAMSSVYLGLKVGLTVSASIPVAVLSITLFKWLPIRGTILENNIAQTTGSAGESLAAGVAFTLPSLLLMGFDLELIRILLIALLGGLIGVLMMIPLRHGLIVKEHGKLTYPEGTACADVLIVGEKGGTEAKMVFLGFFVGLGYAILNQITRLWADTATFPITFKTFLNNKVAAFKGAIAFDVTPPMLGVGYIIGPKVAANMLGGGLMAYLVLIPLVSMLGGESVAALSPDAIRHDYILYIGAGAVAAGGFIALGRSIPTIISAFRRGLSNIGGTKAGGIVALVPRTERDLSMKIVLGGSAAIVVAIFAAPVLQIDFLTALLVVVFGFFFVTVSSRITGEIGSSSNPISGMTIATLLLTCGLFVIIGRTGVGYKAMALSTAALVCVAASNGGTISQDLKTGYLVGATPSKQQISILVGVVTSAVVIGFTMLLLLNSHETFPAVNLPGVTMHATDKLAPGPDGKSYHVAFVSDAVKTADGSLVTRGKYLIDDKGAPMFFVDPAVDHAYPYKLAPATGKLAVAADAPTELGLDHLPYHVVTVKAGDANAPSTGAGRYLVADDGTIKYRAGNIDKFDAPKANLFALIIDGTLGGKLPWGLVLIGVLIAVVLELVGVASLSFAVGLYLPIPTSGGIFLGGAIRWLVDRKRKGESESEAEFSPGMLMASGLIAGGAIAGVLQSGLLTAGVDTKFDLSAMLPNVLAGNDSWWPMIPLVFMMAVLYYMGAFSKKPASKG